MKWFWNVSVQFAKYVIIITLNIRHHDNRQSNVMYTDKVEIVHLPILTLANNRFLFP